MEKDVIKPCFTQLDSKRIPKLSVSMVFCGLLLLALMGRGKSKVVAVELIQMFLLIKLVASKNQLSWCAF